MKRKLGQPMEYIEKLPLDKEELRLKHPRFYDAIVPSEGFAKCPIELTLLSSIESSYNCRGSSTAMDL